MIDKITNNQHTLFSEVVELIHAAKSQAYKAVNTLLIDLYWNVGQYISTKIKNAEWGDHVVPELAEYIARTQPSLRGFTKSNLFRMRQFYETYSSDEIVAPLVRQLSWSHNLLILGQGKNQEERLFYVNQAIRERWSKRELERQLKSALFERALLNPQKTSKVLTESRPEAANVFKDAYVVEFLGLPDDHEEIDLHRGLLHRLKDFLIELGRDFCFVGSEYP